MNQWRLSSRNFEVTLGYSEDGRITSSAFNTILNDTVTIWPGEATDSGLGLGARRDLHPNGCIVRYSFAVKWVRNDFGPQEALLNQICDELSYNLSNGYRPHFYGQEFSGTPLFWTLDAEVESWHKCRGSIPQEFILN